MWNKIPKPRGGHVAESRAAYIRAACGRRLRSEEAPALDRRYAERCLVDEARRDVVGRPAGPLDREDGLPARCVVNADDVMTIPTSSLSRRISALAPARVAAVEAAIRFALDLP